MFAAYHWVLSRDFLLILHKPLGLAAFALAVLTVLPPWTLADSPQFRGSQGWGVATGKAIPSEWSENKNILWKVPLAGSGWSAPVVVGDRLFITSAITEADSQLKPKDFASGVKTPQSMGLGFMTRPRY